MLTKRGVPEIITFLLTFLLLFSFYSEVILHPNDYIFSAHGDGAKNYYTYLYHAKYDSSFWNFSGMNYPYYEHMVYTDGHPLLSYLVGKFGLANYGVGILNFLMLLSFPLCALFIFKILRHYKVEIMWSIAAAVGITFLAPQVFRLTGHFSLSYSFAIPAMWYILIKVNERRKSWKWMIIGFVFVLIFFFTHPYLGMILALFGITFLLINSVLNKDWKWNLIKMVALVILPILLFQFLVFLTDTHLDRSGEPNGFYNYYAKWSSVLVPHHGPVSDIRQMIGMRLPHWETLAYVGFGTILIFVFSVAYTIKNRSHIGFKKLWKNELVIFVIAAWLVLVFSFCFPFKFSFMHWLVDLVSPLKQFRVLGRFAWIFFFVSTVAAVVVFFRITQQQKNKLGLTIAFYLLMCLHFIEGAGSHKEVAPALTEFKNPFKIENIDPQLKEVVDFVNESDYDVIMMLPMQHMSSENVMLLANEEANFDAFMLSYHCHKPLLNSISSRMSITESIQFNNFFSPEYIEKELVYDFDPNDKILIVKRPDNNRDGEMRLVFSSELIFDNGFYEAFDFNADNYNSSYYFDEMVKRDKAANVLLDGGFRSDTSSKFFQYFSYDDQKGESFGGEGAFHSSKENLNILHKITAEDTDVPEGHYVVSFWYYTGVSTPDMQAVVDQSYTSDKESLWIDYIDVKESTLIVDRWARVQLEFDWTADTKETTIFLNGPGNGAPFYVDELMIYKVDGHGLFKHVERNGVEYIVYNNDWVRADSFAK